MAFEVHPSVIANFAPIIIASSVIITVVVIYARIKGQDFKNTLIGRVAGRLKLILILVYGGQFGFMMLIAIIGLATSSDLLVPIWYFSKVAFHTTLTVLLGAFAGFILAAMFFGRGVSAFLLTALLMSIVPLVAISFNVAEAGIAGFMDMFDSMGIIFILLMPSSQTWLVERMLGVGKANEAAKGKSIRILALRYSIRILEMLQRRVKEDQDNRASQAIELLLSSDGTAGTILNQAAVHAGIIEGSEPPDPPTLTIPTLAGEKPIPESQEPKPSGSWTLTNREFKKVVNLNRRAFAVLIMVSIYIVLQAAVSPDSLLRSWTILLVGGFAIISLLAFRWDRSFMAVRESAEEIYEVILPFYAGIDDMAPDLPPAQYSEESSGLGNLPDVIVTPPKERLLTREKINQQSSGVQEFLKRLKERKRQIYKESLIPEYTAIAGMVFCMPAGMMVMLSVMDGFLASDSLIGPALLIFAIGVIVIIAGAFQWYRLTNERAFAGIRRGWLSVALTYLDIVESGIEEPGYIMFPQPPTQQLAIIHFGGPNFAYKLMKSLQKQDVLSSEVDPDDATAIEMKSVLQQYQMAKGMLCILPIFIVIIAMVSFMPYGIGGAMLPLTIIMLVSVIILGGWPLILYRKKNVAEKYFIEKPVEHSKRKPMVADLLHMMEQTYRYPIVLLVTRNHPQLLFTGKSYITSNDVTLHEAVFLPR